MKWIHIVNLTAAAVIIFVCYFFSLKKARQHSIQASLSRVLLFTVCGVIAYLFAILSTTKALAYLFYSAYHILILTIVTALTIFIRNYTNVKPLIKNEIHFIGFASSADIILLLINPFLHCVFKLSETEDIVGHTFFYISRRESLYTFHFLIAYLIIAIGVVMLIRKLLSSPEIYKLKYAIPLIILLSAMIGHILYISRHSTFDYSILFYAAIAIAIFYFSVIYVPRGLMERLLLFTIANMKDGIICVDIDGKVAHSNKTAKEYCGEGNGEAAVSSFISEWFENNPR